ncbi:MAG: FlgD immunoglobulin-like domain containing protein [Balneola sp.]
MSKTLSFIIAFLFLSVEVFSQNVYQVDSPFNSIRQNGVSNIEGFGDTLWISPALNRNIGNQFEWFQSENITKITEDVGRVFSIALARDTVVSGLGFSSDTPAGTVSAAFGYYFSVDGGDQWRFEDFLLDPRAPEGCESTPSGCDTTFVYGGQIYDRIRITVPEQSPPFDMEFKNDVVFSVNWASSLLRSTDFGRSWERIIIPPESVQNFNPEIKNYFWVSCVGSDPQCPEIVNKYDSVDDNNLKGFGLEIDSNNQVWYGSANGVNISPDALTAPTDSISWKHVNFDNSNDGLLGNWVIEIEEDPATNTIWITNWITDASNGEQFGIVSTSDNADTFRQHLIGEKINSIGFKDGAVFAAGDNGLFISTNNGNSWSKFPQIRSANTFLKENTEFLSVGSTTDRVWVGTTDGLASSDDLGQTWEITRVNFPLSGGNAFDPDAKTLQTYAYPNPFSPSLHDLVRIKYELKESGTVNIRVFDFGMNLVREIENDTFSAGTYEAVWDGVDNSGRKVANAPYIYIIEMPDRTINGKILVIE